MPDEAAPRRVVLAGVAGILITAPLSVQGFVGPRPLLGCLLTIMGTVLGVRCCVRSWRPSSAAALVAAVVCVAFATATLVEGAGQLVAALRANDTQLDCGDDVAPEVVVGGQELLHGTNPYTAFNVARAEQSLGCPSFSVTPLRVGALAGLSAAPSVSALQPVARSAAAMGTSQTIELLFAYPLGTAITGVAGAHGEIVLTAVALLLAVVLLSWSAPRGTRRWLALALVSQTGALVFVGRIRPDGIVAALLVVACARREPWVAGASLGVACAIKQTAWILALPLLLLGLRSDCRAGSLRLAVTVVSFVALNLPFVALTPASWLRGILAPETAPEFPLGGGLIAALGSWSQLTAVIVPLTIVMVGTVLTGWWMSARGRGGLAQAGVLVTGLGFWDGPRSLLYYVGILGLVAVGICARDLVPVPARRATATAP